MLVSRKLEICVCGGGHVAHALAAVMGANAAISVTVVTRRPETWHAEIHAVYRDLVLVGRPARITADYASAAGADVIIIAAPAFAHRSIMAAIRPFLAPDTWVGALPAHGFFDWLAASTLGPHARIFGSQRPPYNCRITIPGREVEILGIAASLPIAAAPRRDIGQVQAFLESALSLPITALDNFLSVTLAPLPSILHPARLFTLLRDWDGCTPFERVPLLYEDWDDAASATYLAFDAELQAVCAGLPLDMSDVVPVRSHYGISTASALTSRIRSLPGLRGIAAPMRAAAGGHLPDLHSRVFLEDFPFGLKAIRLVAALVGVETPTLDTVEAWWRLPPIAPSIPAAAADCSERVNGRRLEELIAAATR